MAEEQPTTEPVQVEETTTQKRPRLSSQLAIIAVVIVVILVLAFDVWPTYRRNVLERGAKSTLRELGSAQIAYQATNEEKLYGSFTALQTAGLIPADKTLDNITTGYRLFWRKQNLDSRDVRMLVHGWSGGSNRFTIIAYPVQHRTPNLRTFAISEDQILRVYNPENHNRRNSITSWDKAD